MKKLITMLAVITVLTLIGTTVFAAELKTPWNDNTVKVKLIEDFTGADRELDFGAAQVGGTDGWGYTGALGYAIKDNALSVTKGGFEFNVLRLMNDNFTPEISLNATGFGVYIENNTSADFQTAFVISVKDATNSAADAVGANIISDSTLTFVASDGTASELPAPQFAADNDQGAFIIPSGERGVVLVPFSALNLTGASWDNTKNYLSEMGFISFSSIIADGEEIVFDTFFTYGTGDNFTASNADAVMAMVGSGTDQPATTADISTIAYAVAAVAGCGALVIRKKK